MANTGHVAAQVRIEADGTAILRDCSQEIAIRMSGNRHLHCPGRIIGKAYCQGLGHGQRARVIVVVEYKCADQKAIRIGRGVGKLLGARQVPRG